MESRIDAVIYRSYSNHVQYLIHMLLCNAKA